MSDVFISYARSTAVQAQQIAEALRGLGYGVWRDDELPAHRVYSEVIEERLNAAKAVVVVWSAEAVKSEWVRSEADRARNDRKLVQLTLDGTTLPMPFDQVHCADLTGWTGDLAASGWCKVVASVADLLGDTLPAPPPAARNARAGVSICVLPFANMSDDPQQEYFSDGISEDIITDLSKVSALSVISRNSAFTFKGKPFDLPLVARQLNVSHVLEGSVRKSDRRVRITAQLIDGRTNAHVWAERYDRELSDIFAIQDEISHAIVAALKLKLVPAEKKAIEGRGTVNVEAYDMYLRARALTDQMGAANLKRAIELYKQAITLDPNFRRASNGLVQALNNYATAAPEHRADTLKEIDGLYELAVATDPNHWMALGVRAAQLQNRQDYLGAERLLDEAWRLAPSEFAPVGRRAWFLEAVCRFQEAIELYRPIVRQDPLSLVVSFMFQSRLDAGGRIDEAQEEYERSKDLPGDRGMIEFLAFLRSWGQAAPQQSALQYQRFLSSRAPEMRAPIFDELEPVLHDPEAAQALIARAVAGAEDQQTTLVVQLALLAGAFGAVDTSLTALRRAFVETNFRPQRYLWLPVLAPVRKDAGFKQIVRHLGLYDYWRKSGQWGDFARPIGEDDFECW